MLFGRHGVFLSLIEARFGVQLVARGEEIIASGDPASLDMVDRLFSDLFQHIEKTGELSERYLHYAMTQVAEGGEGPTSKLQPTPELSGVGHRRIVPKTLGQKEYIDAMENYDITFCIGPAGTGKHTSRWRWRSPT